MLFLSFFYDVIKTVIFVLIQNQKVIFCKERWLFLHLLDNPIWRTFCSMLTTDSYGNVHMIEKVAMF